MTDPRRDPVAEQLANMSGHESWNDASHWGDVERMRDAYRNDAIDVLRVADAHDPLRAWLSSPAARDAIARAIYEAAPEMVSNGWGGHDPAPWGEFPATRRAASVYRQADAVLAVLSDPPKEAQQ